MYTDEDLESAVQQGVFNRQAVERFRGMVEQRRATPHVDEESFRLLTGFNDIFVVIACTVVLVSLWMLLSGDIVPGLAVAAASWGLSEYFVRRRRMALPAVALLISYVAGLGHVLVFGALTAAEVRESDLYGSAGLFVMALLVGLHWWRFRVPVTIAALTATVMGFLLSLVVEYWPESWLWSLFLLAGVATFAFAMWWDLSDRQRLSYRSDVAFWLHLLSAPLIVHPLFMGVQMVGESADSLASWLVVGIYLLLVWLSLVIDRRAFMVSSLAYVIFAFYTLFEGVYQSSEAGYAVVGLLLGSALLLLSAWWQVARRWSLQWLPGHVQARLP